MPFTIRVLSNSAERAIDSIIAHKSYINTKTKAVEHALEQYQRIELYQKEIEDLKDKLYEYQDLEDALRTVKRFMNDRNDSN